MGGKCHHLGAHARVYTITIIARVALRVQMVYNELRMSTPGIMKRIYHCLFGCIIIVCLGVHNICMCILVYIHICTCPRGLLCALMTVKQCWDVLHSLFATWFWGMCAASINLCTRSQDHSSALAHLAWLSGTAGADVLCDQRGVTNTVSMGCVSAWQ